MSAFRLAGIFGHGMVLQRGCAIRVFGFGEPGAVVTVSLDEDESSSQAGADGRWMVELPARAAGGPFVMTARFGGSEIVFSDVWIGDVWLCSGQSNMARALRTAHTAAEDIPKANYPKIRLCKVAGSPSAEPCADVAVNWSVCTPASVVGFSAVGYYFGREVHQATNVPIGLIDCSVGGSPIEAWMSLDALEACPAAARVLAWRRESERDEAVHPDDPARALAEWEAEAKALFDAPAPRMEAPSHENLEGPWRRITGPYFFGLAWYEREFLLPDAWAGREILLHLDPAQFSDCVFLNGREIGRTCQQGPADPGVSRRYVIPKGLLKPGKNTLGVRLMVRKDLPCARPDAGRQWLRCPALGERLFLDGGWRAGVEREFRPKPQSRHQPKDRSAYLFNGFIHPILSISLRGMIWYQGEANVAHCEEYAELFPALIRSWRALWGLGDVPFYYVQLPNLKEPPGAPRFGRWAGMREAQRGALRLPNTAMAVTIDVGEAEDIHPANKKAVGRRLALLALARTYREELRERNPSALPRHDSGPVLRKAVWEGNLVRLFFDHAEAGLFNGPAGLVSGFACSDDEGRPLPVSASLSGNTVVIACGRSEALGGLAYAWEDNPKACLCNAEGLPAAPFRLTRKMIDGESIPATGSLMAAY